MKSVQMRSFFWSVFSRTRIRTRKNSVFGHFSHSVYKIDEIKCSNRYETLYADDNDDESCNSYDSSTSPDSSISSDKIFDEISSSNIRKKRNQKISTKMKERKGTDKNDKNTVIWEKEGNSK